MQKLFRYEYPLKRLDLVTSLSQKESQLMRSREFYRNSTPHYFQNVLSYTSRTCLCITQKYLRFCTFMFQVTFLGDGPLGQMTTISADGGYVKGFVGNPLVEPLYNENGKVLPLIAKSILLSSCCSHHPIWLSE